MFELGHDYCRNRLCILSGLAGSFPVLVPEQQATGGQLFSVTTVMSASASYVSQLCQPVTFMSASDSYDSHEQLALSTVSSSPPSPGGSAGPHPEDGGAEGRGAAAGCGRPRAPAAGPWLPQRRALQQRRRRRAVLLRQPAPRVGRGLPLLPPLLGEGVRGCSILRGAPRHGMRLQADGDHRGAAADGAFCHPPPHPVLQEGAPMALLVWFATPVPLLTSRSSANWVLWLIRTPPYHPVHQETASTDFMA